MGIGRIARPRCHKRVLVTDALGATLGLRDATLFGRPEVRSSLPALVVFEIGPDEGSGTNAPAGLQNGKTARRRIHNHVPGPRGCRYQRALEFNRLRVNVTPDLDSLIPNVRDVMAQPHPARPFRQLLKNQEILRFSPRPVTHADPELVPGNHVDKFELTAVEPAPDTFAHMELVDL
jgi:hypothetical protein